MNPLKRRTAAPEIMNCVRELPKNILISDPMTTTIRPVKRNPCMKLKSLLEKMTYIVNPPKTNAVRAKASNAMLGPTRYSNGPTTKPVTVVKLKRANMFNPGFFAAYWAKKTSPISRIKNIIIFDATGISNKLGSEPRWAPMAAVTRERANNP